MRADIAKASLRLIVSSALTSGALLIAAPARAEPLMSAKELDSSALKERTDAARRNPAITIVDGVRTVEHPAAGALLKGSDRRSAEFHCSGTLIGCSTFLTAAHCVVHDSNAKNYKVYLQNAGIFDVRKVWPHDEFNSPDADFAVLTLARPVEGMAPLPLNRSKKPAHGATITIVGFGGTGTGRLDSGIKRKGTITTGKCKDEVAGGTSQDPDKTLLCWEFEPGDPGEKSNMCQGDSGGGLYGDGGKTVAGVHSGSDPAAGCREGSNPYAGDVFAYVASIERAAKDDTGGKQSARFAYCRSLVLKKGL